MSGLLQKIMIILTGLIALWFTFVFANQPLAPLYHYIFLFVVSWVLFYSFIDIAFQPVLSETATIKKKNQKIRRKNNAPNNATIEKS